MSPILLGQGFSTVAILISGVRSFFVPGGEGGCPVHCGLLSHTPGLSP